MGANGLAAKRHKRRKRIQRVGAAAPVRFYLEARGARCVIFCTEGNGDNEEERRFFYPRIARIFTNVVWDFDWRELAVRRFVFLSTDCADGCG